MNWIDFVNSGLVEGVTRLLPLSSAGHLVLMRNIFGIDQTASMVYEAVVYFATASAIVFYFRSDLWSLLQVALRKLGRLPVGERDKALLSALLAGTIPATLLGVLLQSVVEIHLQAPLLVAGMLLCLSTIFVVAEWRYYLNPHNVEITTRCGWLIGWFQVVAFMPGLSSLGVALAGGMLLGLSRFESARFSFLLSIPVFMGMGVSRSMALMPEGMGEVLWWQMGIGAVLSFVLALLTIHIFLHFIKRYTLWPFVWYGIILAGVIFYLTRVGGV